MTERGGNSNHEGREGGDDLVERVHALAGEQRQDNVVDNGEKHNELRHLLDL